MKQKFIFLLSFVLLMSCTIVEPPKGVNYEGESKKTDKADFLYDLTYLDNDGNPKFDRNIWEAVYKLIDDADEFVVIDIFLFNDIYDINMGEYPDFAEMFSKKLIKKKRENPEIEIYLLIDENNNFYGAIENEIYTNMKKEGIEVIVVDTLKLKDTLPYYSAFWRTAVKPFGNPQGKGWITNFYGSEYEKLTIRNLLRALNVKADHRKTFISEKELIVTSANIHAPSYYHSNTGLSTDGDIINSALESTKLTAAFSGYNLDIPEIKYNEPDIPKYYVKYITELAIGRELDNDLKFLGKGDKVRMGMYYLADREVVNALIKAANRGADVKIVFDQNNDAFGAEKKGTPNREVSKKLLNRTDNKIQVRWYNTHGEQYHTKYMIIEREDGTSIINTGSANFIKKNVRGYILDSNVRVLTHRSSPLVNQINSYFNRVWNNEDGQYTLDYDQVKRTNFVQDWIFEFQDLTDTGSF